MASATSTNSKPEKSYLSAAVDSISPWGGSRSSTPKPRASSGSGTTLDVLQSQGTDHSVNHRHGLSARRYPKDCPPLNTRWFYAVDIPKRKPKLLKESNESKPLAAPKKFVTFSTHDSRSIESGYQKLVEAEEDHGTESRQGDYTTENAEIEDQGKNQQNTSLNEAGNDEQGSGKIKVPVNEDFLFDVDVERRELAPVYWLGPIYEVRRGSWFYSEGAGLRPCEENLALQLEEGFLKVKPFRYPKPSEKTEKPRSRPASLRIDDATARSIASAFRRDSPGAGEVTPRGSTESLRGAAEAASASIGGNMPPPLTPTVPVHQPQTYRLFGTYMNSVVTYQDNTVAWLSSDGIMSKFSSTVYQRFAGGGYMSGVKIVRGYTEPGKSSDVKTDTPGTPTLGVLDKSGNPGLQPDERQQKLLKRQSAPPSSAARKIEKDDSDSEVGPKESESQETVLKRQLSNMVTNTLDAEAGEEAIRQRDEKEIQDDYQDHEGEDQSREIEHLILVTHGIGQRLGMRTASVNFVHDVNVLRQTLKSVYTNSADLQALNTEIDKLPKNCRVQVLPVCWRHLLDFPRQGREKSRREHDIGDAFENDDEYPSLEDITIEGVPFVRSLITDLALDILLYQSAYREHISTIVLKECNRIYKLFLDRNPYFDGKVSLVGHSLGSAILFDILCRQKEDVIIHGLPNHQKLRQQHRSSQHSQKHDPKELSFDFSVEDFYCLGSPIGLFQMLKGRTIAARHDPNALPAESPLDPDYMDDPFLAAGNSSSSYSAGERISPTTGLPYTISSPKCARLYNIFHPSDPISYRLEPLIAPAMSALKPQALPYTKRSIFGATGGQGFSGIGSRVTQSVSGLWSSLSSGIASSLLNRSLGLTGEDVANMGAPQQSSSSGSGTNVPSSGVQTDPKFHPPSLEREDTSEKMNQLAKDTVAADRDGNYSDAPTLIDGEIETLYAGFQKRRKSQQADSEEADINSVQWAEIEERARKLRREELKVRGLNQNGRVDFAIQESMLDYNPVTTIASHLSYWSDLDVSHFMLSQMLSRHRTAKRRESTDILSRF